MLKKAQKDQGRNIRTAFMQYKQELANDISRAFRNFKSEVLTKTDKGWEVKKFYTTASVPQVTGGIFNKLQVGSLFLRFECLKNNANDELFSNDLSYAL